MTSRIEFITRGVKIMPRKRVGPVISGTPSKRSVGSYKGPRKKTNTRRTNIRKTTPNKTIPKKTNTNKTTPKKGKVTNAAKKVVGKTKFGKAASLLSLIPIGAPIGVAVSNAFRKKDPTFGEAFKKARKEKGPNSTFNYKGKKYSTVTQDQVKKAGHSTLRSYLNAGGKKKTSVKKPMKRKTGPRNRR